MLEQIAKKDKYWRSIAFKICKDKALADDLVQDMYIKVSKIEKDIDDYYIISIIRNLFLDICRSNKNNINIDDVYNLTSDTDTFELTDYEHTIIERANNLKWWQSKLILENYDKSLREIAEEFNINYGFIHRELKKARKEILKNDYDKYKNKRFKNYSPKK